MTQIAGVTPCSRQPPVCNKTLLEWQKAGRACVYRGISESLRCTAASRVRGVGGRTGGLALPQPLDVERGSREGDHRDHQADVCRVPRADIHSEAHLIVRAIKHRDVACGGECKG